MAELALGILLATAVTLHRELPFDPTADLTPAALATTLKSGIERWRPLISAAGRYAD